MLPFREGETELPQFWQKRFYDFNVYSPAKRREKLEYMHRNPVTRRLVKDPKDWVWSSYSSYSGRGAALLEIDFVGWRKRGKTKPNKQVKFRNPTFACCAGRTLIG
jgi:hypothetical protein